VKDDIIRVMSSWEGEWHGYQALHDQIKRSIRAKCSMRSVKIAMQELCLEGKVELLEMKGEKFNLSGRGWFLTK
jgi:hypothetical protein